VSIGGSGTSSNGSENRPVLYTGDAVVIAESSSAGGDAPGKRRRRILERIKSNAIYRTRGLWLGLVAVGVALYAQMLTTANRDIVNSIHWYTLAIVIMIVGWMGTYKNRSMLVVPLRRFRRSSVEVPSETAPISSTNGSAPPEVLAAPPEPSGNGIEAVPEPGEVPAYAGQLPVRRRVVVGESAAVFAVSAPLPERPLAGATATLPVETQPEVANGEGEAPIPGAAPSPARTSPALDRPVAAWKSFSERFPGVSASWWRYALAFAALALNLFSAGRLRGDFYSAIGSWGWVISLALLLVAFMRERPRPVQEVDAHTDIEEQTDTRIPRKLEIAIVVIIFALGLGLRLLNLGDWTTGMHGDEGEAGVDALNIMDGNRVSPFLTGWFYQPNFYYWGIALTMNVFGTDLFGLRMFSMICGTLLILPFYGLVRMWFGVRTAIIASLLLAFSDVAIHFSKAEFSNITTPLFWTAGFYFFFRGLKTKGTINFVLSGYSFMLSLYFYMGARLTPFIMGALVAYLFLLMPLVRLPGAYLSLRRLTPGLSRLRALRDAVLGQARSVVHYFGQILVLVIASICLASPWLAYYADNQVGLNARTNEKLIFTNEARMASQYGIAHDPLYLGVRAPTPNDIFPFLPVVFEKTPTSVEIMKDGFWPRAIWSQLTNTLSIFTYRFDASSVYTFTFAPVSKPVEAAFLILGLAWAIWRWRDTRMATLSIWFWASVFAGGVLTIDAPYMARMVGIIPAMAVLAAIPVSKLAAEFMRMASIIAAKLKSRRRRRLFAFSAHAFNASIVGLLLLFLALQNYADYFLNYTKTYAFTEVTGQAYFVRKMNEKVQGEGRPLPYYYNLGIHFIYWGHGDNRFLNHGTPGQDMTNPSQELPITDNGDRDVVFMVWDLNRHYLPVLRAYYPDGIEEPFNYNPQGPPLFTSFRVRKEDIESRRVSRAVYTPAQGPAIERQEEGLGTTVAPPVGLTYPVRTEWAGQLVAPAYGRYKFSLENAGDGALVVDGVQIIATTREAPRSEVDLLLARGVHDVRLEGMLESEDGEVALRWQAGGGDFTAIPREFLWQGPGRALFAQLGSAVNDLLSPEAGNVGSRLLHSRVDGFVGYRHTPEALVSGGMEGTWTGMLNITEPGNYSFELTSNGDSIILIDGSLVVNNIQGHGDHHSASGQIDLAPGEHAFELRYNWMSGPGYLEAFWTPPGRERTFIGLDSFSTTAGIVDPTAIANEPPPVQLEPEAATVTIAPVADFGGDQLKNPRGLAIGPDGNVYVGDRGNHRVAVFSAQGVLLRTFGTAAPSPPEGQLPPDVGAEPGQFFDIIDVAVGSDGVVYVVDTSNRVQAFSLEGEHLGTYEAEQLQLFAPNGLAFASQIQNGKVDSAYIAVTGQNRLLRLPGIKAINAGQAALPADIESIAIETGDTLEQPVDLVVDPTGSGLVYAIDLKDRIVALRPGQEGEPAPWLVSKQWRVPVGREEGGGRLAMSPDAKKVYLSDPDRRRVAVLDVASGKVSFFGGVGQGPGQFQGPSGIAVDPTGSVYVLDRTNHNVQVFQLDEPQ
jgi:DNA-binding beta-propeller fold protein YncE/4-amino-4-deoxy-L-arabinose transferase-like glycosyltransferase